MTRRILFFLVVALLLGADDRRWDDGATVNLDGRWLITEIETPNGLVSQMNEPLTLIEGKAAGEHIAYRLYNDRRSIDWIVADKAVTHILPGVYRLRGDTLDIFLNVATDERPTELAVGKARGVFRLTLRRCH